MLGHSKVRAILVDSEFEHLLPSPPLPGVTVIVSRDTGGRQHSGPDPFEDFLSAGHRLWHETQRNELQAVRNLRKSEHSARRDWELIELSANEKEPIALCYTSGTTGRPKGVLTNHRGSYLAAIANGGPHTFETSYWEKVTDIRE